MPRRIRLDKQEIQLEHFWQEIREYIWVGICRDAVCKIWSILTIVLLSSLLPLRITHNMERLGGLGPTPGAPFQYPPPLCLSSPCFYMVHHNDWENSVLQDQYLCSRRFCRRREGLQALQEAGEGWEKEGKKERGGYWMLIASGNLSLRLDWVKPLLLSTTAEYIACRASHQAGGGSAGASRACRAKPCRMSNLHESSRAASLFREQPHEGGREQSAQNNPRKKTQTLCPLIQ